MSDKEENKERKVSDVILSMEQTLSSIHKMISVYDMNTKIILDKVNKLYSLLEKSSKKTEEVFIDTTLPKVELKKIEEATPVSQKFVPIAEKPVVRDRIVSQSDLNQKMVPVVQKIVNESDKDIFMAEVTITDKNSNLLAKLKTNAVGKWQANLPSGAHKISVSKMDTATKKLINYSGEIIVEKTDSVLTLPNLILKK
jgi:hypothetical protein